MHFKLKVPFVWLGRQTFLPQCRQSEDQHQCCWDTVGPTVQIEYHVPHSLFERESGKSVLFPPNPKFKITGIYYEFC